MEVSCGTVARLMETFNVDDSPTESDGELVIDQQECSFWHNLMYEYCGFCEEAPPQDDNACEFPCEYDDITIPETYSEEGFRCFFDYFNSYIYTQDEELCNQAQADPNDCCEGDDDRSDKGSKMNMSKKTGKSMKKGSSEKTMKKQQVKKMGMEKSYRGKMGMRARRTLDSEGATLIRHLRRMLPTETTSTTETE